MKPNNYATLTIWRLTDSLWRSDSVSLYLEADDVVKRICGEGTGGLLVISARHRHPLKRLICLEKLKIWLTMNANIQKILDNFDKNV